MRFLLEYLAADGAGGGAVVRHESLRLTFLPACPPELPSCNIYSDKIHQGHPQRPNNKPLSCRTVGKVGRYGAVLAI